MELLGRISIDREVDALPDLNSTDVRLGDHGFNLHFRQVIGNQKQGWRAEAGGDGLPDVDVARDHHAVDRRVNGGAGQVHLGLLQRRFPHLDRGLGLVEGGEGRVRFGHGDEIALAEFEGAAVVDLGQFEGGLGAQ